MTEDEIKLVVSLARSPDYETTSEWSRALYTKDWLATLEHNALDRDNLLRFSIEELVVFVREYCLYQDLSINREPMNRWCKVLEAEGVQLYDLTPESWSRIVETSIIKKMTQ